MPAGFLVSAVIVPNKISLEVNSSQELGLLTLTLLCFILFIYCLFQRGKLAPTRGRETLLLQL